MPKPPDERLYWYKVVELISAYDGDSLWLKLDVGFNLTTVFPFRLESIDTPELGEDGALAARDYLRGRLNSAQRDGKPITIRTFRKEKFGRWLGRLYIGSECLNDTMLDMKLGKPYEGGAR